MTRDQAVAVIQEALGFRSDLANSIITQLVNAQVSMEEGPVYPWFLLSLDSTIVTTASNAKVKVPTDFLEESEDHALYIEDEDGNDIMLEKEEYDHLKSVFGVESDSEGFPTHYSLDGLYFRLFPIPDGLYTLRMSYYKRGEDLSSSNIENVWLKHAPWVLIGLAGERIASSLRDDKAKTYFHNEYAKGVVSMNARNEGRAHANRRYIMGGKL